MYVSTYLIITVSLCSKGLLDPDPPRRGGGEEGVPGGPETLLQLRPLPGHGGPRQDMLSGRVMFVVSRPWNVSILTSTLTIICTRTPTPSHINSFEVLILSQH